MTTLFDSSIIARFQLFLDDFEKGIENFGGFGFGEVGTVIDAVNDIRFGKGHGGSSCSFFDEVSFKSLDRQQGIWDGFGGDINKEFKNLHVFLSLNSN